MKNTYIGWQRCVASKLMASKLILILGTALIVGAAATVGLAQDQQARKLKSLFAAGTEVVAGVNSLPDPLRPYDSLIDAKHAEKSPIKQTAGCDQLEAWQPVIVQYEQWRAIDPFISTGYAEVGVLAIQASTNCVKAGHPMRITHFRLPAGIGAELGWFFPTSIVGRRTETAAQEARLMFKAGLPVESQDVVFVTGRVIATFPFPLRPSAPRMIGARFIDRGQLETAIRNGTQIIDVRSAAGHGQFKIKGSISIPYTTGPRMNMYEEYSAYVKAGDAFDIRRVQPDKTKPVVVIGSFNENNVYRAAVVLRSEGWKNVLVFWEGIEYFTGMVWTPPVRSELVSIIDGYQAAKLINDRTQKTVVLDARRISHFSMGTIAGSYTSEFFERNDLYYRSRGLNGGMLVEYGERVKVPQNIEPGAPVIVVGYHERDWRGYKAALILRHYGFGNVSWYRGGVADWMILNLLNPAMFPVDRHPWPLPMGFIGGPKQ
jgi:rhodanese-related sulfurtransferase